MTIEMVGTRVTYEELVGRVVRLSYRSDSVEMVGVEITALPGDGEECFELDVDVEIYSPMCEAKLSKVADDIVAQIVRLDYRRGCIHKTTIFPEPFFKRRVYAQGSILVVPLTLEIDGVVEHFAGQGNIQVISDE